ncbi:MAG: hypothetical protein Q4D55_02955 [Eubacteriales bacterium]|nr:hypothetical protein [Eubacteriales bacterium]
MNGIRVCVDHSGSDMGGRAYSKLWERPLVFRSGSQLLVQADRLFDKCGYPQTFQEKRSFLREEGGQGGYRLPRERMKDEEILSKWGGAMTFDIVVVSRRRVSWQGYVRNMDGKTLEFRSEVELLAGLKLLSGRKGQGNG